MNRYLILIVTLALLTGSCLNKKNQESTPAPADSTDSIPPVLETVPPPDSTTAFEDGDCVFDSSTYAFTTEAARKSLWLAQTFFDGGFDEKYVDCISKGLFRRTASHNPQDLHAFEIIDQDTAVTDRIVISGYVN